MLVSRGSNVTAYVFRGQLRFNNDDRFVHRRLALDEMPKNSVAKHLLGLKVGYKSRIKGKNPRG